MPMVALDAARRRIVPNGSIEARWMVEEEEVEKYIEDAKQHQLMQDLMDRQAESRLQDEQTSALRAELETAHIASLKRSLRGRAG